MKQSRWGATLAAVAVIGLVCGATAAGAAKLITGADIKNGSLTGADIKNGSLGKQELATEVRNLLKAAPIRVTGALPTMGFSVGGGTSVANTPDGVTFGPYADGGSDHGTLCTDALNGQTLNHVKHLAYVARYTSDGDTGGVGVPYLRIFLAGDHDTIFSPNTQPPDPDVAEGPFHTWVATAGLWRYDDDAGSGGQYGLNGAPFSTVKADHGSEQITDICITTGFSAGSNLSALLRGWEVNSKDYAFGL